jgi:hypothetical protein
MKRRKSQPFPTKRVLTFVGTGLLFLLLAAAGFDQFDKWHYRPKASFDASKWNRPNLKYRYSVTNFVIHEIIKPGMTESQVVDLLGTPNAVTGDEDWQYETQQPGLRSLNWTGGGLLVKFDPDRKVVEVINNTIED